jgi:hypothetical protein
VECFRRARGPTILRAARVHFHVERKSLGSTTGDGGAVVFPLRQHLLVSYIYAMRSALHSCTHVSVFGERQLNLLCRSWVRHPVAVGESLQESDEGIFFLVRQFKVSELLFIEVG